MNEEVENRFLKDLFRDNLKTKIEITPKVMQRIEKSSEIFEYRPVISKSAWIIIGTIFIVTLVYLIMQFETNTINYPELITSIGNGFSKMRNSLFFDVSEFNFPIINSFVLIAIMSFNIIGIYLIFSYRWSRRLFK